MNTQFLRLISGGILYFSRWVGGDNCRIPGIEMGRERPIYNSFKQIHSFLNVTSVGLLD